MKKLLIIALLFTSCLAQTLTPGNAYIISALSLNQSSEVGSGEYSLVPQVIIAEDGKDYIGNSTAFTGCYDGKLWEDGVNKGSCLTSVVNNLTSDSTTQALSAYQGKLLNNKINSLISDVYTKTEIDNKLSNLNISSNYINSLGNKTAESGATKLLTPGLSMQEAYNNGYPTTFGNVINLNGNGDGQILVGWSGTSGAHAGVYVRSQRDVSDADWSPWAEFITSNNIGSQSVNYANSSNYSNSSGYASSSGNADTVDGKHASELGAFYGIDTSNVIFSSTSDTSYTATQDCFISFLAGTNDYGGLVSAYIDNNLIYRSHNEGWAQTHGSWTILKSGQVFSMSIPNRTSSTITVYGLKG